MDQLIISWLGNREQERSHRAQEKETERANRERERETRRHNVATEIQASHQTLMQSLTQRSVASTQAAATRYASDRSAYATQYAADTAASASRYKTLTDAWTSYQHEVTSRSMNAIQDRFNQGRLAIMASELHETARANKAREQENSISRHQNMMLRDRELEFNKDKFAYQQTQDWLNRVFNEKAKETDQKLQFMRNVTEIIGDLIKAYGYAGRAKGGINYVQGNSQTYKSEEQVSKEFWKNLNEAFDRELTR